MSKATQPRPVVHLIGSIPLDDAESVFRTVAGALGSDLARLPDGETGKRIGWIRFLETMLAEHPDFEVDPESEPFEWRQWDGKLIRAISHVRIKPGTDLAQLRFETGYADDAVASFEVFDRLQSEGAIPAGVRFQICLPTPLAPCYNFVSPASHDAFLPVYESHILGEVQKIATRLPNDRLALQWDVCQEVLVYENHYPYRPGAYKDQILSELQRIGDAVPGDIDLGYHLCYGSPRDEHLVQPRDLAISVELANGIAARVGRAVQFIHMPVPKERSDDAYFEPLSGLTLSPGTDLYLGLVHHDDPAGDAARLAAARRHARVAGISSECGWGRGDPERVPGLIEAHRRAAALSPG